MRKVFLTIIVTALTAFPALGQNVAIVDATVHTMSDRGTLENATILIRDGKIQSIMTDRPALAGIEIIDAKGMVVTPGLMGAYTSLGLVEVGSSAGTVDSSYQQTNLSTVGAALDVSYAVNPMSSLMGISRIAGVTSAATSMNRTNQLFQGQGAIISLADDYDTLIKPRAFVTAILGNDGADDVGGSRASLWVTLNQVLKEAQFSSDKSLTPNVDWHGLSSRADAKALTSVVSGEIPLIVEAHRAADILQVIALKNAFPNLNLVVLHATEGWRVAEQLAQAKVPVILNPESNLPYEFDQLAATLANAGRLQQAGVIVAIGVNTHNIRLARQHAGNAVAHGMDHQAGIAALTINPAKIYGVDSQMGSLEEGKRADLVIWTGDPLEVTETAHQVMIDGEMIDMTSRQTKLRDRYLTIIKDKSIHYQR